MEPTLIGSRALNFWFPEFKVNTGTDWDVISVDKIDGTEHHPSDFLNNAHIATKLASDKYVTLNGTKIRVMGLTGLAIIKRSHLWRPLGFQKHITHYHKWLSEYFLLAGENSRIFHERKYLTAKEFPFKSPSLRKNSKDFFCDAVTRKYDHDWLHEMVSPTRYPMYKKLIKNDGSVFCEKDKWDKFTHHEKLQCVLEEVYVTSLERFLIPADGAFPPRLAFMKSLEKVCTTMCSGWFRDFALDFYPELVKMYAENMMKDVLEKIENTPTSKRKYHVTY